MSPNRVSASTPAGACDNDVGIGSSSTFGIAVVKLSYRLTVVSL
jgi:hypothetical protein